MVRNVFTKKGRDSRMGVFRFNPEMGLYSLFPSKGQKLHVTPIQDLKKFMPGNFEDLPYLDHKLKIQDQVLLCVGGEYFQICCVRG